MKIAEASAVLVLGFGAMSAVGGARVAVFCETFQISLALTEH